MKAVLALGAALALSGCAYYDPYVYDSPYYGGAPYGSAPQPYYYGYDGALLPFGYGAYGYGWNGYPNVYPHPWAAPGPRLRPRHDGTRPDARVRRPHGRSDDGDDDRRSGDRAGGGRRPGGSTGAGGSGWTPGGGGVDPGALGGGGSGYVPNQPTRQ
jgi:hypothetical protein